MEKASHSMITSIGWYKAANGSKWHVDWVGDVWAVGHSDTGGACIWLVTGSAMYVDGAWNLVEHLAGPPKNPPKAPTDRLSTALDQTLRSVILGIKGACSNCYHGLPLWVLVRDCSTHGRTKSQEICRLAGFDPDQTLSSKPLKEIRE